MAWVGLVHVLSRAPRVHIAKACSLGIKWKPMSLSNKHLKLPGHCNRRYRIVASTKAFRQMKGRATGFGALSEMTLQMKVATLSWFVQLREEPEDKLLIEANLFC